MLAFPAKILGVVLKWTATLILVITVCGCSYPVFRAYDGSERPLKEIAVLLVSPPIFIKTIDNKNYWIYEPYTRRAEYHLPAGHHSIVAHYSDYWVNWKVKGDPITLNLYLSKGLVYKLEKKVSEVTIYDTPPLPKWYELHLRSLGTIEEIAPTLIKESDAPSHWRKILETNRPSNNTK